MNDRNLLKGLFLILIALAFGIGATNYPIGRVERAGPGFFPLMVSSLLGLLAVFMVVRSRFTRRVPMDFHMKNISIILASLVGFAVFSRYLNMISGIVVLVFVAGFAANTAYSIRRNAAIAAVLIGIAFVFQRGLGLQLPLY